MAWESRGGPGRYFTTTTRRTSGRRVRTYYGNGVAGDLASSMQELRRRAAPEPVQDVARSNPAAPAPHGGVPFPDRTPDEAPARRPPVSPALILAASRASFA
jgi:hypothetical protein